MTPRRAPHAKVERNDDWQSRYAAGESVKDIAESAGTSRQRVYQVLNREGRAIQERRQQQKDRREAILELHRRGVRTKQICFDMGVSTTFVNDVIRGHRKAEEAEGRE